MTLIRCKVVVVGDPHVGKSAMTQTFLSNTGIYPKNYIMTLGVDFSVKAVPIPGSSNTIELYVFDMSGQQMYADLRKHCGSQANMVIAAFDISQRSTYVNAKQWIQDIREINQNPNLSGVLVACKSDLKEYSDVNLKDVADYARSIGFEYMECSAADAKNTDAPFLYIANAFNNRYEKKIEHLNSEL